MRVPPYLLVMCLVAGFLPQASRTLVAHSPFEILHRFSTSIPVGVGWIAPTADGALVGSSSSIEPQAFRLGPGPTFSPLPNVTSFRRLVEAADGKFYGSTADNLFRWTPDGLVTPFSGLPPPSISYGSAPFVLRGLNGAVYGWRTVQVGPGSDDVSNLLFAVNPDATVQHLAYVKFGTPFGIAADGTIYGLHFDDYSYNPTRIFTRTPDGTITDAFNFGRAFFGDLALEAGGVVAGLTEDDTRSCSLFRIRNGVFRVIHVFPSPGSYPCTGYPSSLSVGADGNLYGHAGDVVFRATPTDVVTVLHEFSGGPEGRVLADLAPAPDGVFWGATKVGGAFNGGAIFRMSTAGVVTVVASVAAGPEEGTDPAGPMLSAGNGLFYAAMRSGGVYNCGTIVRTTRTGELKVLYTFTCGADGRSPYGLIYGPDNAMYGTTRSTIFRIAPSGALTTLFYFRRAEDGDGVTGPLALAPDGLMYGTTGTGGRWGSGTAFRISVAGAFETFHHFEARADSDGPSGPLVLGTDGRFYGTRGSRGQSPPPNNICFSICGAVFALTIQGDERILHLFRSGENPGPELLLFRAVDGTIIGRAQDFLFSLDRAGTYAVWPVPAGLSAFPPIVTLGQSANGRFYGVGYLPDRTTRVVFQVNAARSIDVLHVSPLPPDIGYVVRVNATLTEADDGWLYGTFFQTLQGPEGAFTFRVVPITAPTGVRIVR